MKSCFILIIMIAVALCSCTPKQPSVPEGEYLIRGELKNIPDSLLVQLFGQEGRCIQVDTLLNGEFTFRDTVSSPHIVKISFSRNRGFRNVSFPVWVASGKYIKITGENKLINTWQVESEIPEQQEENRYTACVRTEEGELMKHMVAEGELVYLMRYGRRGDLEFLEEAKIKRDSIDKLIDAVRNIISEKTIGYMKTAPVTSLWIDKLTHYAEFVKFYKIFEEDLNVLYNRMSEEQKQSEAGKLIYTYLNPESTAGIGDEMVDGDLYDLDGRLRHLSEFKGKFILLDFWAGNCGPCIASIPEVEEVTTMYKEKMVVISISEDPENEWKKCVAEKKMGGNQWNELRNKGTGLSQRYRANGIPHYVLIAPDGRIQDVWNPRKGPLKEKIIRAL